MLNCLGVRTVHMTKIMHEMLVLLIHLVRSQLMRVCHNAIPLSSRAARRSCVREQWYTHCLTKNLPLSSSPMDLWSKRFPSLHQGPTFIPGPLPKQKDAATMDSLRQI